MGGKQGLLPASRIMPTGGTYLQFCIITFTATPSYSAVRDTVCAPPNKVLKCCKTSFVLEIHESARDSDIYNLDIFLNVPI